MFEPTGCLCRENWWWGAFKAGFFFSISKEEEEKKGSNIFGPASLYIAGGSAPYLHAQQRSRRSRKHSSFGIPRRRHARRTSRRNPTLRGRNAQRTPALGEAPSRRDPNRWTPRRGGLTGMSVTSQCLQKRFLGLALLGASGSTSTSTYFLLCKRGERCGHGAWDRGLAPAARQQGAALQEF